MTAPSTFASEINEIRSELVELASRALKQIERSVAAWDETDSGLAAEVIALDEEIDTLTAELDWKIYQTQLLQSPMAGDQRLLHVGLIAAIALERVGDLAVEISVAAGSVPPSGQVTEIQGLITKMAGRSVDCLARSIQAIARSDVQLASQAVEESRAVRDMLDDVMDAAARGGDEPEVRAWTTAAVLVGRHLERVANNGRELGGRVEFLVDGRPFSRDAGDA